MPDVGLFTATEPLSKDMKVVIKYSVEVNGLAVYSESYDVATLADELKEDEAKAVEIGRVESNVSPLAASVRASAPALRDVSRMGKRVSVATGTARRSDQRICGHGTDPHRHLGMDLSPLARTLLPQGLAAAPRTRICLAAGKLHRDQRLILFSPATRELPSMV